MDKSCAFGLAADKLYRAVGKDIGIRQMAIDWISSVRHSDASQIRITRCPAELGHYSRCGPDRLTEFRLSLSHLCPSDWAAPEVFAPCPTPTLSKSPEGGSEERRESGLPPPQSVTCHPVQESLEGPKSKSRRPYSDCQTARWAHAVCLARTAILVMLLIANIEL
jgi:hypothetical protein